METCEATKTVPTAEGDKVIRCTLEPGHADQHFGRSGTWWPVRWDQQPN